MSQSWRAMIYLLLTAIVGSAVYGGIRLRREIWAQSDGIRFWYDANNAYTWGGNADKAGVFTIYARIAGGQRYNNAGLELDYTPLRLLMATGWRRWTDRNFPGSDSWQRSWEFTEPLLRANTIAALLASLFVFLTIRLTLIRADDARRPLELKRRELYGVGPALVGAMLLWFNPALLWDGYAWPQWDVWPIPFAVAAIYFACRDLWLVAGICLAIGASLKGQLLIAAPIMFLWPLFQLRFGALLRIIAGFAIATMLIALPFMLPSRAALIWYMLMMVALGLTVPLVIGMKLPAWAKIAAAVAAMLLAWPWGSDEMSLGWRILPLAIIAVAGMSRFAPIRLVPQLYTLLIAIVILLMMPLFAGSDAWYTQGFNYGANRDQAMHQVATNNLPNILQTAMRWPNNSRFLVDAPLVGVVEMKTLMAGIYGICLAICGIGAAILFRRRDPRFLIAMFLPWLLFFLLLTQMRGRYLVWAAAMAALLAGTGPGMTLLGLVVMIVSTLEMVQNQYILSGEHYGVRSIPLVQILSRMEPHLGWALLLIAAIGLYRIVIPRAPGRFKPLN